MIHRDCLLSTAISCFVFSLAAFADDANPVPISFRCQIAPILLDNCLPCHGAKKAEGGYRVDSFTELTKAGDSGLAPIAAAVDQPSELLRRIICSDPSERMPAESEPLAPPQVELVKQWIAAGGKFDGDDPAQFLAAVMPPANYPPPPQHYPQALPITATIFSTDGKQIITGGYHELVIWNAEDGSLLRRINNIGQRVFALSFSPDGRMLAIGCGEPGKNGEVRLVDFVSGEVKAVVARANDVILDVAYRPGSNQLAVASADSLIRIVDVTTLQVVKTIASHADWVTAVTWSDDGTRLASASRDKSAKVYDAGTGELIASYLGHGAAVRGVTILADNKQVISAGADKKLQRWNIEDGKKIAEIATAGEGYKLIRNATHLYLPCSDHRLLQIELAGNKISQEYKGHQDWVLSATIQPNVASGGLIASGSFDGEVRLWNTADTTLIRHWNAKP